jgi:hypothetical protein
MEPYLVLGSGAARLRTDFIALSTASAPLFIGSPVGAGQLRDLFVEGRQLVVVEGAGGQRQPTRLFHHSGEDGWDGSGPDSPPNRRRGNRDSGFLAYPTQRRLRRGIELRRVARGYWRQSVLSSR